MANTQQTWQHIAEYLDAFHAAEGAEPNRALYYVLGSEALGIMAEQVPLYATSWSNTAGGPITLTSATCPLPIDLIELRAVEYDGSDNPLERTTVEYLDTEEAGWREATGDPDKYVVEGLNLVLNSIPSSTTGKLVLRGTSYLPELSDTAGATNPLSYAPWRFQTLIREYIIAKLPLVVAKPEHDSAAAYQWATQETARRQQLRAEAWQSWERGLAELRGVHNRRKFREFRY